MMACINTSGSMPHSQAGQIQIIFGPMFSGKTTELMRRMRRYQLANYQCLIVKYANDVRYDKDGIATHDRQTLPAVGATNLKSLMSNALEAEVIGVDEGQFFPDVVEFCEILADMGKTVIVAALDGTFQRQGFGDILALVPLAESVVKLTAVCMTCYGEASFTKRKGIETEVEVIGGADKYLAVCRACYKPPENTSPMCSPGNRKSKLQAFASPAKGPEKRQLFGDMTNLDASLTSMAAGTMETAEQFQ